MSYVEKMEESWQRLRFYKSRVDDKPLNKARQSQRTHTAHYG